MRYKKGDMFWNPNEKYFYKIVKVYPTSYELNVTTQDGRFLTSIRYFKSEFQKIIEREEIQKVEINRGQEAYRTPLAFRENPVVTDKPWWDRIKL